MAQLVSSLDAVYKRSRNSWQDTSPPPNLLVTHLGPGEVTLDLQVYADVANQSYHRDSMKGQTADVPNLQPLFKVPNNVLLALGGDDLSTGNLARKDSQKGQTADPQNFVLGSQIFNPAAGMTRMMVINPIFNKHPTQETTIQRNPVLDIISNTLPQISPGFETEQSYRRDSVAGQYGRSGAIGTLGVPPAFNEIYTPLPRLKTAQEPHLYPNLIIIGIAPLAPPQVQRQGEDRDWRGKKTQEPYQTPNIIAYNLKPTSPFVQRQGEDRDWRGKKTQETYQFPNALIVAPLPKFFATDLKEDHQWRRPKVQETYTYPNLLITQVQPTIIQPFVQTVYSDANYRSHKTQEHFDFPNVIFYDLPPLPPPVPVLPVVPSLVGLILQEALWALQQAGVLVPSKIGYFGTYPVSVNFVPTSSNYGIVTAQSLSAGLQVKANTPIILTCNDFPMGVVFP